MEKFEVKKEVTVIISTQGVSLNDVENSLIECNNREPELIASFDSLSAATSIFDSIQPRTIAHGDGKTFVCDYIYLEANEYNEDGEFISGGDVYFAKAEEINATPEDEDEV